MDKVDANGITVTHLNIRPSISLLIGQLVLLDILVMLVIIGGYLVILQFQSDIDLILRSLSGLFILWAVFLAQIFLTIFASLQWINDYYELTPTCIIHKKGVIFRKIEKYSLENLMYLNVEQSTLGTLLNYGTLTFLSQRREKLLELYLIHNPNKYLEVIENLKPNFGKVEQVIRGEIKEDENGDEADGYTYI